MDIYSLIPDGAHIVCGIKLVNVIVNYKDGSNDIQSMLESEFILRLHLVEMSKKYNIPESEIIDLEALFTAVAEDKEEQNNWD